MRRRRAWLAWLVGGVAALLIGCATTAPSPRVTPEPASPADAPIIREAATLTYWEEEGDDGDVLLDRLTAEFRQRYPLVAIERVHLSSEELLDRIRRGGAPDLARCASDCTGPISASGQFRPAAGLFDQTFLARFLPGALEAATLDGVVWGIPDNYGGSLLLIYNKDLVSAVPTDTETWIAQLRSLTNPVEDRWGLAYFLEEPYWLAPWIGGFGGWLIDEAGRPTLDTPAGRAALRFVRRLRLEEGVTPPRADYDMALDYFRQGRAAYLIDGDWSLERLREAGISFGIAALPTVRETGLPPTPAATARHWFIGRSSAASPAQRAAAAAFVAYMSGAQAQQRWLVSAGRLPSAAAIADSPAIAADPLLAGAMAQLRRSRGLPAAAAMRCVWRAMRPPLVGVMAGQAEPEAAAAAMQAAADACIKEGGRLP